MPQDWRELVAEKRARQEATIPREWILTESQMAAKDVLDVSQIPEKCGLLTPKEIEITNSTVELLLPKLASGEWSSVEVTTAFYKRAIVAHQLASRASPSHAVDSCLSTSQTNCLTEIFVEKALARAAEVDAHLKSTGTVLGPLHGLPISLKDQIGIEGLESTMGSPKARCISIFL